MNRNVLPALTFVMGLLLGASVSAVAGTPAGQDRGADRLVTGIGGVFFKARSPEALREWYREHLGLEAGPDGTSFFWRDSNDPDRVGRTVWSVFSEESDYFGASGQQFMVNYRVADLEMVLSELRKDGIEPVKGPEDYPYGRFAWIVDGEGNRIELWEPPLEETGPVGPSDGI